MDVVIGTLSVLALAVAVAAFAGVLDLRRRRVTEGPAGVPGPTGPKGERGEPGLPGVLAFDVEKLTDDDVARIAERLAAEKDVDDAVDRLVSTRDQPTAVRLSTDDTDGTKVGEYPDGTGVYARQHYAENDLGVSVVPGPSDDDPVNHPSHYTRHPAFDIEAIEVTRQLGFARGNAIKYLWRAGRKDDTRQDVEKAIWYITDAVEHEDEHGIGLVDTVTERYLSRAMMKSDLDRATATAVSAIVQIATGDVDLRYTGYMLQRRLDDGTFD